MEIKMLIGDTEYLQSFAEMLMNSSSSVLAERVESFDVLDADSKSILLTDRLIPTDCCGPDRIERIVYLTSDKTEINTDIQRGKLSIFKYDSVSNIISQLSMIQGDITERDSRNICREGEIISVCGVSDSDCTYTDIARFAARHISYQTRKSVLLISARYINPYRLATCTDSFIRLIYALQKGRPITKDAYFYEDEYGVSYLRTSSLVNRLTELSAEELRRFADNLLATFDFIVFDMGSSLTDANISLIDMSSLVIFAADGVGDKEEILPELSDERTITIRQRNGRENLEMMLDAELNRRYAVRTDA